MGGTPLQLGGKIRGRNVERMKDNMDFSLSVELKLAIEKRYGTGEILQCNRLKGGYWNDVIAIRTEKGRFVLRISHPTTKAEGVKYEHTLMKFMNKRINEVLAPVEQFDNTTVFVHEGRIISVYPFMIGEIPDVIRNAHRVSAAKMLAQLHLAALECPFYQKRIGQDSLKELNWEQNHMWNWKQVKRFLENDLAKTRSAVQFNKNQIQCIGEIFASRLEIEQQKDHISKWLLDLVASKPNLLFAPTHGDYYKGNLLFKDDKITAVIDWDESRPDWLSYELARATWEFCEDENHHTLNREKALNFVSAYQEAGGPVPSAEFNLLVPFIRCVRIIEVLFHLGQASQSEEWDPEYTLHNLKSLMNLYDFDDLF
jgi:Ser/Thr protein kinase RdoA (MazF antagonist)